MKIILFSRSRVSHDVGELRKLFTEIELRGYQYCINEEFAPILESMLGLHLESADIYSGDVGDQPHDAVMICYGGDGTLLEGVRRLGGRSNVVVGINSGRLGFLTCVSRSNIGALFNDLERGALRIEERSMIAVSGEFSNGERLSAANEVTVMRHGASIITVELSVDGEAVATYYGDGVIVATPTGSTAYSLSAGGPIVSPDCGCWVVTPIAPHNVSMRPILLPDSCHIELKVHMREGDASITVDNQTFNIGESANVELERSSSNFYLGLDSNISFYETLKSKMMWGIDPRG
ncbi:MAG: NAD(+)/NADH kinase [Rikenellaceae bacterium]